MSEHETEVARNIEEQLSAFLDGELLEAELQMLVRRLEKAPAHRATLVRYVYARSVLRNEPVTLPLGDFRAGVMHAISADEQTSAAGSAAAGSRRGYSPTSSLVFAAMIAIAAIGLSQVFPDDANTKGIEAGAVTGQPVIRTAAHRNVVSPERMTSYMVAHGEFSRRLQGTLVDSRIFVQPASYQLEE